MGNRVALSVVWSAVLRMRRAGMAAVAASLILVPAIPRSALAHPTRPALAAARRAAAAQQPANISLRLSQADQADDDDESQLDLNRGSEADLDLNRRGDDRNDQNRDREDQFDLNRGSEADPDLKRPGGDAENDLNR